MKHRPYSVVARLMVLIALIAGALSACTGPAGSGPAADSAASFGNDHFGHWITDAYGLPAFSYTDDEATDRAARWNTGNGISTGFWHQSDCHPPARWDGLVGFERLDGSAGEGCVAG